MSNSFTSIVEKILLEANPNTTLYQQISTIYQNKKPSPSDLKEIAGIASRLEAGGYGAIRNSTLNTMKPAWPYIDILDLLSNYLPNKKDIADLNSINLNVGDFLKKAGYDNPASNEYETAERNILAKIDSLNNPSTYVFTAQRLKLLNNTTNEIALTNYRNLSPLQAVIEVTRKVGGYRESDITDIMSYPLAYDLPTTIKLPELEPIRQLAFSLVTFYQSYLIQNLENIKSYLPDSVTKSGNTQRNDGEIAEMIKRSAGSKNATNNDIKQDYINFLKGKSQFLQEVATEAAPRESFDIIVGKLLNEVTWETGGPETTASSRPTAASTPATTPNQNPTNPPKPQQQNTPPKPTRPIVRTLNDFSDIGDTAGQQVWNNYVLFFNSIKAGSLPSKWKKAGRLTGAVLGGIGKGVAAGLTGAARALGGFKGF